MTAPPARFVAPSHLLQGSPLLRRSFHVADGHGDVIRATLRVSALGVVEAHLNGRPAAADVLTPGWTSYEWRIRFAEHDVTHLVVGGENVIGLALGDGWYRGRLGWKDGVEPYGDEIAGYADLRILFADGHEQVVVTDESWCASSGAVLSDSLYDGQVIDARRAVHGWDAPGFDDAAWGPVHVVAVDAALEPYVAPPVRRTQEVRPVEVSTSPSGRTLVDFGQNLVGWVRATVRGDRGTEIVLRHAEVVEDGELGTRPLRYAKATDRFVLSGGDDVFEPTFTFHGFRYVDVEGWPGDAASLLTGMTAVVVGTTLRRTGELRTSDPLLDRLHDNVVWGLRGNFLDVPTDCPQRDERLGWTGDIAVFAPTATYLFDVQDFLRDWLRDLALEQEHNDDVVPFVVPDILKRSQGGTVQDDVTAIWSDAAVWVPWAMYQSYGDPKVLEESYPSVVAHLRRARSLLGVQGVWDQGFQFGDWLDPDAPPDAPGDAKADPGVVATAALYRSTQIGVEIARVLGRRDDMVELDDMAKALRRSFRSVYVRDDRVLSDCTTVYTLAVAFGLLDDEDLVWAGERLAELVAASGYRISTGFAGTPFICDALTRTGHIEAAYRLLMQTERPSWLYPVTMGATTVWERWDSMLPDGSINPGDMTSFNHYALGAVADWMHRTIGGIAPLSPGYDRVLVAPRPGGGLTWAEASLETPHGRVAVRWEKEDAGLLVDVEIPVGTTAVLRVEGEDRELSPGRHVTRHPLDGEPTPTADGTTTPRPR